MKTFRTTMLWLIAAIVPALLFSGCGSKPNGDIEALLESVPSSASAVTAINVANILSDLGCKPDGKALKRTPETQALLDSLGGSAYDLAARSMLDDSTGVERTAAVTFIDSYATYFTALLEDSDMFREWVEGATGQTWTDNGSVQTCGNVAMKGNCMWVCLSRPRDIDAQAVANFSSLSRNRSFASNASAESLLSSDHDIMAWGDIAALLGGSGALLSGTGYSMAVGMLFEDASAISGYADFEKGQIDAKFSLLNSKGKPAKYLLPAEKIDIATVERLGHNATMIAAFGYPSELTDKIVKLSGSLGGALPAVYTDMLKPIDGTVAVAVSKAVGNEAMRGVVTTDDTAATQLSTFLSTLGSVRRDGKLIFFSRGDDNTGTLDVAKSAPLFKDASIAMLFTPQFEPEYLGSRLSAMKQCLVGFYPSDGSMQVRVRIDGTDPKANLLPLLLSSK